MKRNRKNNIRRERIVMIASSAFVLAALTLTGVYMKDSKVESEDDGYSMDFTALEDNTENKFQEIAQNNQSNAKDDNLVVQGDTNTGLGTDNVAQGNSDVALGDEITNMENDLDYMPMEAGSHMVEIPGLTDGEYTLPEEEMAGLNEESGEVDILEEKDDVVVSNELHFAEEEGLVRPTAGDVLMHYSMDRGIYFETLDNYRYNPAVMFSAEEGSAVSACADGKVVDIYNDAKIGHAVTIDLGDGYQAIYGQLKDIQVTVDSYVEVGETIGSVAAPTKYFIVEGSNLYFQLTKDGEPVNPENLF